MFSINQPKVVHDIRAGRYRVDSIISAFHESVTFSGHVALVQQCKAVQNCTTTMARQWASSHIYWLPYRHGTVLSLWNKNELIYILRQKAQWGLITEPTTLHASLLSVHVAHTVATSRTLPFTCAVCMASTFSAGCKRQTLIILTELPSLQPHKRSSL